jgi:hypothetical protein
MPLDPQERAQRINEWRDHHNRTLAPIGFETPMPKVGQTVGGYRRYAAQTIADSALPQIHSYAKMDWEGMPFDVFKNLEPQLYQHAVTEYRNPANVPKGEFRAIVKKDSYGEVTNFIGQESFIKYCGLARPGRRVARFRTPTDSTGQSIVMNVVP